MRASATQRQVPGPGQPVDAVGRTASRSGKPRHLGKAAGDDGSAGIVAKAKADGTASGNRDHILHRAADRNAKRVCIGIDAKVASSKAVLNRGHRGLVCASGSDRCWQPGHHLVSKTGAGQNHGRQFRDKAAGKLRHQRCAILGHRHALGAQDKRIGRTGMLHNLRQCGGGGGHRNHQKDKTGFPKNGRVGGRADR